MSAAESHNFALQIDVTLRCKRLQQVKVTEVRIVLCHLSKYGGLHLTVGGVNIYTSANRD
jgi:hypothetical protein